LLLGELNQKEASGSVPPVPLSKQVLPKLIEVLKKEGDVPLLRYAAILGIARHAELIGHPKSAVPLNAADKEQLAQLMIKLATDQQVPDGVDSAAHNWQRAKAVKVLGDLYLNSAEVVTALANLLVDDSAGLDVRCAAAAAAGKIGAQVDKQQADDLVGRLTKLTHDCVETEFEILRRQSDRRNGRGIEGYQPAPRRLEGMGQNPEDTERTQVEIADERTTPTRRRLLFQLLAIQQSLMGGHGTAGLAKSASTAEGVEPLNKELTKLLNALQDVELEYERLGGIIQLAAREELPAMVPENLKGRDRRGRERRERGVDMAAAEQRP
jgi:hypothetical protein